MGSRGAFKDVDLNDFTFNTGDGPNQKTYETIDIIDDIYIIMQTKGLSVKAPEYSHTANRTYGIIQDGKLKHLAFYNENHVLFKSIDFGHTHNGLKPHVHYDLYHEREASSPTKEDWEIINKITRRYKIKWQ